MKILQLIQKPQLRGAEIFACQLSDHLVSLGHECFIVSIFQGEATLPGKARQYHMRRNQKKRLWDYGGYRHLAKIIHDEMPDVIQANAGDTLKYAVISRLLFGWKRPIIFRNASTISLYIKTKPTRVWNSLFFNGVNKVISVSNHSALDFSRVFPIYKERVTTIPIGIEKTSGEFDKHEASPFVSNQKPIILHVGGFSFEKNHEGLINIFKKVLIKSPTASLHLVGSGLLQESIREIVDAAGLESKVIFHGFQSNALQFIRHAHVLVLPSIIEGLPGVILEAFSCKTPVVAYDVGGIGEILKNDDTGRSIAKGNELAFAEAVHDALSSSAKNERMIHNAYKLVSAKYLNTEIAKDFLAAYTDTVSCYHSYTPASKTSIR